MIFCMELREIDAQPIIYVLPASFKWSSITHACQLIRKQKKATKKNILFSVVASLDFRVSEEGTSLGMFARMSFISANGIILLHYFYFFFDKYFFFFFCITYSISVLFSFFASLSKPHDISKHDYMPHSITLSPLHQLIDQIRLSFANIFPVQLFCLCGLLNVYEKEKKVFLVYIYDFS